MKIKTVSFSRLTDFEKCKHLAKLKYVDRIPEPARPLPAGKTEHANDRGTRIHEAAEHYVRGGIELVKELASFREDLKKCAGCLQKAQSLLKANGRSILNGNL